MSEAIDLATEAANDVASADYGEYCSPEMARAALAAIHDPTPEMIAAGDNAICKYITSPSVSREVWRAMWDEMMREGVGFR